MAGTWGDRLRQLKQHYFVGREAEKEIFQSFLLQSERTERILYLYGPGGIGKSTLIDQFGMIAEQHETVFMVLDSRDFSHSPEGFCEKLYQLLDFPDADDSETVNQSTAGKLSDCLALLFQMATEKKIVLAIDTYEEMGDLDDWLRDTFLVELPDNIIVVLAGRLPLSGEWLTPIWSPFIQVIPLSVFDWDTYCTYAAKFPDISEKHINELFFLTKGHPLTLSLILNLSRAPFMNTVDSKLDDVLKQAASWWLREVSDPFLQEMIEAASIVRIFNKEMLETMLNETISIKQFEQLTALSFVRKSKRGWFIHDLLRGPLNQESKRRQPTAHENMWLRCMEYMKLQLSQHALDSDFSLLAVDLIYVLGDSKIRSIFLDETTENSYYVKALRSDQLKEAYQYMQRVTTEQKNVIQQFFDPHTHKPYENVMPFSFIKSAYELLHLEKWAQFGDQVVYVIRNGNHEAGCLIVVVPIHSESLPHLASSPVSKHYFQTLSQEEREKLAQSPESPAGWFFYHLDQWGDHSSPARSTLFQMLMLILMRSGLFVHSSPLQLHQDVMISLGFEEVPAATHYDFGHEYLARTFHLDLRGDQRFAYLEKLLTSFSPPPSEIPERSNELMNEPKINHSPLTRREKEIVEWVLKGLTNVEISKQLYLSEVTIKKHLGNIYAKLGVNSKAQLVKSIMKGNP